MGGVWKNATEESARRGTLKFLPTEGGSRVRRTLMTDAPRVNEGHIELWRAWSQGGVEGRDGEGAREGAP